MVGPDSPDDFVFRDSGEIALGWWLQMHAEESSSQIQSGWRETMNRSSLLALGLLVFSTSCFGQTTPSDSQTLQALLTEIRLLRQDLRATTVAAQRSQILIYRLQGQEAAVGRASQRLDEVREKLASTEDERKHVTAEVKQIEDFVSNIENPATQRKELESRLSELKTRLGSVENDQQQNQSREIEAEQQLRAEEVRLSDLRDQLDRLDKTLENASRRPDGTVQ
jgi:chromosome segregation ATPase